MKDKDKEAFESWCCSDAGDTMLSTGEPEWVWLAACEYKDKECSNLMDAMTRTSQNNAKLQAENAKLRECVEFYADEANQIAPIYKHDGRNRPGADFTAPYRMDEGKRARQVLKELEDK